MDEREFELINILGADLGSNQREISRHMNVSLGMINMLIRRLISKGYIRIEQLNKRKVQYILTPKGFSEKMRKSVKYTLKTINSVGLIKDRIKEILAKFRAEGVKDFYFYGNSDIRVLTEMVLNEVFEEEYSFSVVEEIPQTALEGVLLICKEDVDTNKLTKHHWVDLVGELAKENQYPSEFDKSALLQN